MSHLAGPVGLGQRLVGLALEVAVEALEQVLKHERHEATCSEDNTALGPET